MAKNLRCYSFVFAIVAFFFGCTQGCGTKTPEAVSPNRKCTDRCVLPSLERAYSSSVSILDQKERVLGAGTVVYRKKGFPIVILTAAHVVDDKDSFFYLAGFKRTGDLRLIIPVPLFVDKEMDLAIMVGVTGELEEGATVGIAKENPKLGESIWIIGSPNGIEKTISRGIVSNILTNKGVKYIQTDGAVYFGNSGGGAFNKNQELVGVVDAMMGVDFGGIFYIKDPHGGLIIHRDTIYNYLKKHKIVK